MGGKYLYCLIEANNNTAPEVRQGLNGGVLYPVFYRDIAAVTSEVEKEVIKATNQECLIHEKVLELIMKERGLLPFEFGTVSPDKESVINLLKDNYHNIKRALGRLRDKQEANVKAVWSDMQKIFKEILSENRHIALYKKEIEKKPAGETYEDRIKIGQLVAQALYVKKEKEMYSIVTALKRNSSGYAPEKVTGDSMVFNGAFLVKKANLDKFESTLYRLGDNLDGRIDFTYAGPLPPYNFTNLTLKIRG